MFSDELFRIGKSLFGNNFIGVFPLDMLPGSLPKKCRFIVNTQTHNLAGEHWLAVSKDGQSIKVYDPYGFYYPSLLVGYLHRMTNKVTYNRNQYQHENSKLCGEHALLWLLDQKLYKG